MNSYVYMYQILMQAQKRLKNFYAKKIMDNSNQIS